MSHMDRKVSLLKHFPSDLSVPLPLLLNSLRLCPYADAVADRMKSLRAKSTVPLYMTHLDVLCVLTYVSEGLTPAQVANLADYLQNFAEGLRRDMRKRLHAAFSGYAARRALRRLSKGVLLRRYERSYAAKTIAAWCGGFRVRRRLGMERSSTLSLRRYSARGGPIKSPLPSAVSPRREQRVMFSPRRAEPPSWTPRPILRNTLAVAEPFQAPLRSPGRRRRLDPVEESLRIERELEEERRQRLYNRSKWA